MLLMTESFAGRRSCVQACYRAISRFGWRSGTTVADAHRTSVALPAWTKWWSGRLSRRRMASPRGALWFILAHRRGYQNDHRRMLQKTLITWSRNTIWRRRGPPRVPAMLCAWSGGIRRFRQTVDTNWHLSRPKTAELSGRCCCCISSSNRCCRSAGHCRCGLRAPRCDQAGMFLHRGKAGRHAAVYWQAHI